MLTKFRKSEKGFTLIELLIVVAIIGILAAIAIPQFSAYRIRGYNAAANADLRNSRTSMEAFFSDWQVYPSTDIADGNGPGALYTNTTLPLVQGKIPVPQFGIVALIAPSAATTVQFPVSAGVGLVVSNSAGGGSFTMSTKNVAGDRCFGADSDTTQMMWISGTVALSNAPGTELAPTTGADDLSTKASIIPCTGNPAGTGQLTWVPLS